MYRISDRKTYYNKFIIISLLILFINCHKQNETPRPMNRSPYLQLYTSFDGNQYSLYTYEGSYVSILMRNKGLDSVTMFNWVHTMDNCYLYYKSVTGREPAKQNGATYLNNRTTIADVQNTCGAGCGYLGATGIEILNAYTDRMYNFILQDNQYDQEPFYEFGRNFWFYGDQLAYKNSDIDPVTTGYAVFMRFMAIDATKVTPAPFNSTPFSDFRTAEEGLVDAYVPNINYNWSNTLGAGAGISNPMGLGATDLVSSFLMRLTRDYGGDAFVHKFWKAAGSRPAASATQDAVDNFVLAACSAANKNLTSLFITTWRWPVSAQAQTEASAYPK
jgi:serralysin